MFTLIRLNAQVKTDIDKSVSSNEDFLDILKPLITTLVKLGSGNYDNIKISGNHIQNAQRGIRVGNGGAGASVFVASISSNTLTNNDVGIWGRLGNELTVTGNSISGNTVGIKNDDTTVTVNAENNYWGAADGFGGCSRWPAAAASAQEI